MNLTALLRPMFIGIASSTRRNASTLEQTQRRQLRQLLRKGAHTEIGRQFDLASIDSYEQFAAKVPLRPYETIKDDIMRMVNGEADVLWPGVTRRFAQSSGTSDGRSKYIPVTRDALRINHYGGSARAVAFYLEMNPDSRIFDGKAFILGGSFANELKLKRGVKVGDLSANLIDAVSPLVNLVRVPRKKIALMQDWTRKLPALVEASTDRNVTNISGVPSWFLTVLHQVMKRRQAKCVHEVWPNLEVFFHGGISFEPYRHQYAAITDPTKMHYIENYNASEGFFAVQDRPEPGAMLLLPEVGVFYEFQSLDDPSVIIPSWQVEQGRTYALIITSCNGLWRYPIGDTVTIQTTSPLRISMAGRTKSFINAFGEELMVFNAEAALARTCAECHCSVSDYTVAPVYAECGTRGHHQWLIEFSHMPDSIEDFAERLDRNLQRENSDYQAKRTGDLFLDRATVDVAPTGLFDRWLASTGKLGGQRKVPRLANDRKIIDAILALR